MVSNINEWESRMQKAVDQLRSELVGVRAGRAAPALVEKISVEYYGANTPINQLASINVPEPRLLIIQPWDKSVIASIERAILKSDLGLNPSNDGIVIRIAFPQLTEERRKELVKYVKKKTEEAKVVVRNIRRDANDYLKKAEKQGDMPEDEKDRTQEQVQKLTDRYIEKLDEVLAAKETEILEV